MPDRTVHSVGTGGMRISLLTGDEAYAWLAEQSNLTDWRVLYAACSWATSFQTPDFYLVWLRHYAARWRPVLVLGLSNHGRLAGLIPLAIGGGVVTGAGANQAEYHGWLGGDDCPSNFFKDAVAEVLKKFPGHELRQRYLPPGTPKAAVEALINGDHRAIAIPQDRPLLALNEGAINETLKKKNNRSKINRLKRLGAYCVRQMDADEFERRIDEIGAMCDFRQGAVNDSCPFLDDTQKRPFHLDWVRSMPRDVHVSGMFVDDQLISILIFALSKREAHIAITAHSPTHAENSPGKIHIYEAALALAREGYSLVDMTPGGDEWKFRFATETDKVIDLTVFASARKAALVRLRRTVGASLRSAAARGRAIFSSVKNADAETKSEAREAVVYSRAATGATVEAADSAEVRVNALSELLRFGPGVARQSRQHFLSGALARMEAGDRCYSLSGRKGVVGLGWRGGDKSTVRLSDFSTDASSDARRIYQAIVQRMIADLKGEASDIRISVPADDPDLKSIVESLGFQRDPL